MSKLFDLLNSIITKVNKAVRYSDAQNLTDEQKAQARTNIYASEYVTDVDALLIMYETGIITPVSDNTDSIYTDNNGLIYIL